MNDYGIFVPTSSGVCVAREALYRNILDLAGSGVKSSIAATAQGLLLLRFFLLRTMASTDIDMTPVPSGEGSSAQAGPSTSTKKAKRFEIKKWNAVALWAWGTYEFEL
jgi:hypothetical protein